MKFKIDELLDGFEEQSIQFKTCAYTSSDKIVELTMAKIESGNNELPPHPKFKRLFTVFIAAVLVFLLSIAAYAAYSIHQQRQQQLRETMNIDDNEITSYVEYAVSSTPAQVHSAPQIIEKKSVTLLSAIRDDTFQRVYVNVSPVSKEEALAATEDTPFFFSLDNGNLRGFAKVPFDESLAHDIPIVTMIDKNTGVEYQTPDPLRIQELQLDYSYDESTKTLTLLCKIAERLLPEQGLVTLQIIKNDGASGEVVFGSVSFTPIQTEARQIMFSEPLEFYNEALQESCFVSGVQLCPTSVKWLIEVDNGERLFGTDPLNDDERSVLINWLNFTDIILKDASLIFDDGTEFETGTILTSPYENGYVMCGTNWNSPTIDIHSVTSVRIQDRTVLIK